MEEMTEKEKSFSRACTALLKGVVDRGNDEKLWQDILNSRAALKDYLSKIGLQLYLEELDGYAYLRQNEKEGTPRLVPRRQLSYGLSILLVQLRKWMGEFDVSNGDQKLIVTMGEMRQSLEVFFSAISNEEKYVKRVERCVQQAEEMGMLRKLAGGDEYEVRPILRSFVTAEWLRIFDERLQEYKDYGLQFGETEETEEKEEADDGLIFNE